MARPVERLGTAATTGSHEAGRSGDGEMNICRVRGSAKGQGYVCVCVCVSPRVFFELASTARTNRPLEIRQQPLRPEENLKRFPFE